MTDYPEQQEKRAKNLIRTWYNKSCQEDDLFAAFVFVWFCFNAWAEHSSDEWRDSKMIGEIAERRRNMQSFAKAYDSAKKDDTFKTSIQSLVEKSPIKNARDPEQSVSIKDGEDFGNIVRAIYAIRCNLFHGGKGADDKRDQELVKIAADILKQWVWYLKEGWKETE